HNAQTLNQGTITVPTTAYRNGDLSSLLLGPIVDSNGKPILDCLGRQMINGAVYDPKTTRTATCTDGSTATVRDPFPNNFIGAPTTWDPVAQKVLTYIPTPSVSRGTSRVITSPSNRTRTTRLTALTARQPRPGGTQLPPRRYISMRTIRPHRNLCSTRASTTRATPPRRILR